jgi:hypothetical protein
MSREALALRVIGPAAAAVALLLSGCTTASRVAVPPAHRSRIQSTQAIAAPTRPELGMHIEVSTAGGGFGLIGAIVDSSVNNSRAKDAEAAVVPARDALVGYEVGAVLAEALKRELAAVLWLKAGAVEVRQMGTAKVAAEWLKQTTADALLVVETDYRLSPKGDAIVILTQASLRSIKLFPRPAGAEEEERPPLYLNGVHVYLPLPNRPAGALPPAELAKLWAADGGKPAREALDVGLSEVARMLAFDIEQGEPAGLYEAPAGARKVNVEVLPGPFWGEGFVVAERGGRSWVRLSTGQLCSMP